MVEPPCMGCDCCHSWQWRDKNIERQTRQMFEAFLNRIYNISDFDRLGPPSVREREIIDNYLKRETNGQDS